DAQLVAGHAHEALDIVLVAADPREIGNVAGAKHKTVADLGSHEMVAHAIHEQLVPREDVEGEHAFARAHHFAGAQKINALLPRRRVHGAFDEAPGVAL